MKLNKPLLTSIVFGVSIMASGAASAQETSLEGLLSDAIKQSLVDTSAEINAKIANDVLSISDQLIGVEDDEQVIGILTAPETSESEREFVKVDEVERAE
ncbi:MAG: hypothetical protein AAGJ37_11170 [Pseudomonadota bacterium]